MVVLDADIMSQLRATFKIEAEEHIQAMNRILLALEKGPDEDERAELLKEIFRDAHSMKGAAGAADFGEVEATAHKLESILSAATSGKLELTPDMCDILYEGIDAVSIIVDAALEDEPHGLDLTGLYARLDAALEGRVDSPPPAQSAGMDPGAGNKERELELAPRSYPSAPVPAAKETTSKPDEKAPAEKGRKASKAKSGFKMEETIRVSTSKVDSLMTQTGELLVAGLKIDQRLREIEGIGRSAEEWNREWLQARASYGYLLQEAENEEAKSFLGFLDTNQGRLKTLTGQLSDIWRGLSRDALNLSRVTVDLGAGAMKLRMLPASTVFDTFPRMVRDLAREKGKEIDIVIEGATTELDKKVLEQIKDPLVHLLRNCIDHGIKPPEERAKAGKPSLGTISLTAFQKGNNIIIEMTDDGAGIDVEKVKRSALKMGICGEEELSTMSDEEALQLIFASGLSTAPIVTDTSGRGVGMDVVRKNIESLHGHVEINSVLGVGTTTTLVLPLTLATTQELLVQVREHTFGIPISAVERILRIRPGEITTVEGIEAIVVSDEPISLVHLSDVLELARADEGAALEEKIPAVILSNGKRRIAFLVDAVVGQQESVVTSLGKQLSRVRNVTGATILGTGQVIMALNPIDLIKSARKLEGRTMRVTARVDREPKVETVRRPTVLVVDDSLTTRALERNILEAAGYDVRVAIDGMEALGLLQAEPCDLVVTDALMPRMDGFELTASVKRDPKLRQVPIVLVTSLESPEDKERGIEVGASAYIVKSTFDQANLLETIEQLI